MPSISELLIAKGESEAGVRRRRGERAGALVTSLGQIPAAIVADRQAAKAAEVRARVEAQREARAQAEEQRAAAAETRTQTTFEDARTQEQRGKEAVLGWMKQHAATLKPEESSRMEAILAMPGGAAHLIEGLSKAPAPYTLGRGEQRRGANNELLADNPILPEPPKPKDVTYTEPRKITINGKKRTARPGSDGGWYIGGERIDKPGDVVELFEEPKDATDDVALSLTAQGMDQAAHRYLTDGTLPPMGMGKAGAALRTKILNRAAELDPNADIASNRAGYRADSGSLVALQKQRDAITSFEQTAQKNIDIFLETAGKVVDSGSPLINRPVRELTGRVLGSPDQAAYEAARQVALNEIAKIITNPNLSGVLSDSARKEVSDFNPASATLKQSVAVMRVLKRDMANRAKSMDDTIADIKGRMKNGPPKPKVTITKITPIP